MINESSFMFSHHFTRQLLEILNSLVRYLNLKDVPAELSLLNILSYNFYVSNNSIYLLLRIRFFTTQFWGTLFEKQQDIKYLKPQYFKKPQRIKRIKLNNIYIKRKRLYRKKRRVILRPASRRVFMTRTRFVKKRLYSKIISKKYQTHLLVNRINPLLTPHRHSRVSKKLWIYFILLPYLLYIKRLLIRVLFSKLAHCVKVGVFFLGVNQRSLNASVIIDFIVQRLQKRQLRISRLLYDALRVLKRLVRAQSLTGYKLLIAGRFSRRDRATYVWKAYSSIPLSTKLSNIDYQYRCLQMKYSLGIFKLWISRR